MAKTNKKNKGVTAGELFGKLGRSKPDAENTGSASQAQGSEGFDPKDSIDVTSDSDSDSDLDINALLKKYMPEYKGEEEFTEMPGVEIGEAPKERPPRPLGILSALKKSADSENVDEDTKETLMDKPDSALTDSPDENNLIPEKTSADETALKPKKPSSLAERAQKSAEAISREAEEELSVDALAYRILGLEEGETLDVKEESPADEKPNASRDTERADVSYGEDDFPGFPDEPWRDMPEDDPTPEVTEDEPKLPAFTSLVTRMEQNLMVPEPEVEPEPPAEPESVSVPQPEPEEPVKPEPELSPEPEPELIPEEPPVSPFRRKAESVPKLEEASSENDELLADVAEAVEEDEEELVNPYEDEKRGGLFSLFRKKKKKDSEPTPVASEKSPFELEAEMPEKLPEEAAAFTGFQPIEHSIPENVPEESAASEKSTELSEGAVEPTGAPEPSEKPEKKRGLFARARLEKLIAQEESGEPTAAEAGKSDSDLPFAPISKDDIPSLSSETRPQTPAEQAISEEELVQMVHEMEDAGEAFAESDDSFGEEYDDGYDDADPTDISLMVAFGMDSGGGKTSGKAREFGDKLQKKQETASKGKVKLDRSEYVDKTQTRAIRTEYQKRETSLWIRLALCAVFTLILMIFENIGLLTRLFTGSPKQFAGVFDPAVYPTVYVMTSLQLMLLACVCAYDEIFYGLRWLFRGSPRAQTVTALLTVIGIGYSAVTATLTVSPDEPVMFNFVTALAALLTLVNAIYNIKRERMNFRVVANKRPKHIVRRLQDEEAEGETRAFQDAADVCDVMKIEKTDFVDGFFARLQKPDPSTSTFITCLMSVTVALAVLFVLVAKLRGGNGVEIARVFYAAVLMIAPLSIYIAFSYPFYRANAAAQNYRSAIIGEASLEEYSNASIISFDDKNVFPSHSVKVQNIRIYNNARIDRVLYYASSAFAYAGGPLQDVFEVATREIGNSKNVHIFDTEAGFLATQVDGVNIIFGSYEALTARGLTIDPRIAEEDEDVSDELEIMYMFRESKLVAKLYVKYVMDPDIDPILKQFSGSGLYVCVRTFDPNIDEAMIASKLAMKKMPLKIVRYNNAEEVSSYEAKVDSGLVTCGKPKSLLQVISYCGKVLHTKKTNVALSVLSVLIGASILLLLLLSNTLGSLTSFAIVLYQSFWLITMSISSRAFIR